MLERFQKQTSIRILKFKIMQTINFTAYTEDLTQIEAIKAFMKALKIKFEVSKDQPYDPEFVTKILEAEQEIKQGKGLKVTSEEFDNLWK